MRHVCQFTFYSQTALPDIPHTFLLINFPLLVFQFFSPLLPRPLSLQRFSDVLFSPLCCFFKCLDGF
jgi:hypothetical protein